MSVMYPPHHLLLLLFLICNVTSITFSPYTAYRTSLPIKAFAPIGHCCCFGCFEHHIFKYEAWKLSTFGLHTRLRSTQRLPLSEHVKAYRSRHISVDPPSLILVGLGWSFPFGLNIYLLTLSIALCCCKARYPHLNILLTICHTLISTSAQHGRKEGRKNGPFDKKLSKIG